MATVTKPERSRQLLGSSLKVEIVQLTSVSNDDTFTSKLQNPEFALAFSSADAGGTTTNMSATVSGKTVTIRDPATTSVVVLVFGQ